jgi:hypothetical protein
VEQQSVQAAACAGGIHLPAPPDPGWQPPVRSAPWPLPGRCAPARAAGWGSESGRCSVLPRVVPGLEFWKHRPPFQPSSLLPAGLEDLDIGCQALERFPPALHGATALRRLVLGSSSLAAGERGTLASCSMAPRCGVRMCWCGVVGAGGRVGGTQHILLYCQRPATIAGSGWQLSTGAGPGARVFTAAQSAL